MWWLSLMVVLILQRPVEVEGEAVYACEGEMLQFACNTGVLLIKSATYGRPMGRTYRCGENQNIVKKCTVDATQLLKYTCDNQLMCEIYVDVATFMTEMCPDARKFVDVVYECVPPRTVTTVNRCQQKCLPVSAQPVSQMATKYSGTPAVNKPVGFGAATPAGQPPSSAFSHASPPASHSPFPPSPSSAHTPQQPLAGALPYTGSNVSRNFAATLANLQVQAQRAAAMLRNVHASMNPLSRHTPTPAGSSGTPSASGSSQSSSSSAGSTGPSPGPSASSPSGSATAPQSASSRSALLARMQRVLAALRARKAQLG